MGLNIHKISIDISSNRFFHRCVLRLFDFGK